jgi:hypothetical protein
MIRDVGEVSIHEFEDVWSDNWPVHVVPSHQRKPPGRFGSGYHPGVIGFSFANGGSVGRLRREIAAIATPTTTNTTGTHTEEKATRTRWSVM